MSSRTDLRLLFAKGSPKPQKGIAFTRATTSRAEGATALPKARFGVILGRMSGRRRIIPILVLFAIASRPGLYAQSQAPCPIALLSAKAEKDTIQLEFMNKGKVPVEQLSLACLPAGSNKFPNGVCHVETGISYPGAQSWIKIDYIGATRHSIDISVAQLRLSGGILWQPTPSNRCKNIRVTAKK